NGITVHRSHDIQRPQNEEVQSALKYIAFLLHLVIYRSISHLLLAVKWKIVNSESSPECENSARAVFSQCSSFERRNYNRPRHKSRREGKCTASYACSRRFSVRVAPSRK